MPNQKISLALQEAFNVEFMDAKTYLSNINQERIKTLEHYNMKPYSVPTLEGRSAVMTSEVYDTVNFLLPALMRIFFNNDSAVRYIPTRPILSQDGQQQDVSFQLANQLTEYVTKIVLEQDNNAFQVFWDVFKDALTCKIGVLSWYWDEGLKSAPTHYTGVTEQEMQMLQQVPNISVSDVRESTNGQETYYNITVQQITSNPKVRIRAIPPEEFLIARSARSVEEASFIGYRAKRTTSQLIEMGYSYDLIQQYASDYMEDMETVNMRVENNPQYLQQSVNRQDKASQPVNYVEAYIRYDNDGDGVAELLKISALGGQGTVVSVRPVERVPYAIFCPDPTPHEAIGSCPADKVVDIQRVKTQILRDTLDSLAMAVDPRLAYVEGKVNADDLQNRSIGSLIRTFAPQSIETIKLPFVGGDSLPVLDYLDTIKENRTGASKASMGLNAEALQSSTAIAVDATVQAATGRVEMIARIFAETGMKTLYRGLLKLITTHQDKPRTVQLLGQWVDFMPNQEESDVSLTVTLGLNGLSNNQKAQNLMMFAQKQEALLQMLGMTNPLSDIGNYAHTLTQLLRLGGFRETSPYVKEITPQIIQQMQQQQQQAAQQPTPEQIAAQSMAKLNNANAVKNLTDSKVSVVKMLLDNEMARDKLNVDSVLKAKDLEGKYGLTSQMNLLNQLLNAHQADLDRAHEVAMKVMQQTSQQEQPQANGQAGVM